MPSTFNLVRNTRVFFTTNVETTGLLNTTASSTTSTNTFELQVLDGFSFSQANQQATIQINEAGNTPTRGQRAFNTQLDPVEFSFSTYIRPNNVTTGVSSEEMVLWNALFSSTTMDTASGGVTPSTATSLSRATSLTPTATIAIGSTNLAGATPPIAIGDVINIGGLAPASLTNVKEWAGPAKLLSVGGTTSAATSLVVEYLSPPSTAAGITTSAAITGVKLYRSAVGYQGSTATTPQYGYISSGNSNKNTLQKFAVVMSVDNAVYTIENCVLDSASIDFGLDGIAMVQWSGKGTRLQNLASATIAASNTTTGAVFSGTGLGSGTAAVKNTAAPYITNKLSTLTLNKKILGTDGTAGNVYTLALTGGNITISNNVNYVIPQNLGVVNTPVGYFTGTRSISGNVTAYLRTGSLNSGQILTDILADNAAETKFQVEVQVGGSSNATHVDFRMNGCLLQIPTVETGDVMSTTINFNAQGYERTASLQAYDIEATNDLIAYYFTT